MVCFAKAGESVRETPKLGFQPQYSISRVRAGYVPLLTTNDLCKSVVNTIYSVYTMGMFALPNPLSQVSGAAVTQARLRPGLSSA